MRWLEDSPYGPMFDVLAYVEDMGQARRLAEEAELTRRPTKAGRLTRQNPLTELARTHPGELLWRITDDEDTSWRIGAAAAAQLRAADVTRFTTIRDAARRRRKNRR